jgi:large subunit ribosomal protein L17
MRHRRKVKKLGRTASHRRATLRNLASALINHHQIKTTQAKAKAARSYIEKLITTGKKDTVQARRQAFKFLQNRTLVKKLFDEIAPTFSKRNGGYTRIVKLGPRLGDGAEMAILQLVGFEQVIIDEQEEQKKKRTARAEKKKAEQAALEAEAAGAVETVEPEPEVKEEKKETKETKETKKTKDTKEKKTKTKEEKKESKTTKKPAEKKAKAKEASKDKEKKEKASKAKTKAEKDKKEDKKEDSKDSKK